MKTSLCAKIGLIWSNFDFKAKKKSHDLHCSCIKPFKSIYPLQPLHQKLTKENRKDPEACHLTGVAQLMGIKRI